MAAVVGLTMVLVGLFISWRVRATHDLINTVDAHLLRQDADTKAMIENQAKILENQNEGLSRLRRLAK